MLRRVWAAGGSARSLSSQARQPWAESNTQHDHEQIMTQLIILARRAAKSTCGKQFVLLKDLGHVSPVSLQVIAFQSRLVSLTDVEF